ncbi:endonuclease/exonuclease/phosphatase family protein [Sinobacterium caligoides]|uniref:Endonuclease/exonuclease/phosphatase family protein n=1 Tax=Sinobacterium caligoides TaxID=933926 RepID=A0A3N2DZU9_9GAMM|nr:endonuclease/exonuclease/phosphatase family protein [Sinobacterium caligoides]ROS05386.1 endonuclease/exonuclease/phosphatase family protein [Sinobacterium caligoides]
MKFSSMISTVAVTVLTLTTLAAQADSFSVLEWNSWVGPDDPIATQAHTDRVAHDVATVAPDVFLSIETYGKGEAIRAAFAKAHGITPDEVYYRTLSCRDKNGDATDQQHCVVGKAGDNLAVMSVFPIIDERLIDYPIDYPFVNDWNFGAVKLDVHGQGVWVVDTWFDSGESNESRLDQLYATARGDQDTETIVEETSQQQQIDAIIQFDQIRTDQAKEIVNDWIADIIADADDTPVVLAGDHNASSHLDWSERDKAAHYGIVIPYTVSRVFADAGFRDSFREVNPNVVAHSGKTWSPRGNDTAPNRIDYIYYKGDKLQAIDSTNMAAIGAGAKDATSDHAAVYTRFKLYQ